MCVMGENKCIFLKKEECFYRPSGAAWLRSPQDQKPRVSNPARVLGF
jgi:hypothetical protein